MQRAVVVGGTGLIGGHVLQELSARGVKTEAVSRRVGPSRPGVEWRVQDLASITGADLDRADAGFCCLGSTIKAAGSQAEFRRIDHDLVLAFASACRQVGVAQLHVVSAMGADAGSRVFYNRVKGEMERDLRALGFPRLVLYRPSLLEGRHQGRPAERLIQGVAKVLRPVLPANIRAIPAADVARAMVRAAERRPPEGTTVVLSGEIARAAS